MSSDPERAYTEARKKLKSFWTLLKPFLARGLRVSYQIGPKLEAMMQRACKSLVTISNNLS